MDLERLELLNESLGLGLTSFPTQEALWAQISDKELDMLSLLLISGITLGAGTGDALKANNLDQFADVAQTAGKTLTITDNTTLSGGTHSGTNTGDQTLASLGAAGAVGAADIEITDAAKGLILASPDASRWRLTIDDTGTLISTSI